MTAGVVCPCNAVNPYLRSADRHQAIVMDRSRGAISCNISCVLCNGMVHHRSFRCSIIVHVSAGLALVVKVKVWRVTSASMGAFQKQNASARLLVSTIRVFKDVKIGAPLSSVGSVHKCGIPPRSANARQR